MPCLLAQKERQTDGVLASPKMVADGQRESERGGERAPLPLIFAGETQESAGGNERRNVHYFSAASHDRFLARIRRQTKIPPRKPRTDLGFPESICIFRGEDTSIPKGSLLE